MQLSKRMMTIAKCITPGKIMADIGTDHGYVPIYLVENNVIPSALAMDINKGPIEKATTNIKIHGLENKIITRLSDGLTNIEPGEANTILIAGMGGELITSILNKRPDILDEVDELVLGPHSEPWLVRHFLVENGFMIDSEYMILDEGKYYVIIKAVHGNGNLNAESDFVYGKYLPEHHDKIFEDFITKERESKVKLAGVLKQKSGENALMRLREVEHEVDIIDKIIAKYY